jgi:putative membrane protein
MDGSLKDSSTNPTQDESATRRTLLAGERTALAWWRTGLAALAVAVGIGRIAPELRGSGSRWPYIVVGIGFAVYGIALFLEGTARGRDEATSLGEESQLTIRFATALAAAGPILGLGVIALIAFA